MRFGDSNVSVPGQCGRLDYNDLNKRNFFEMKEYVGLHWKGRRPVVGIYELRPRQVQLGLRNIVEDARNLLWNIDSHRCAQRRDSAVLVRTGLDRFIKRIRNIVRKIPYEAATRIAQRHLAPVM